MSDNITIKGIKGIGKHGVFEEEKINGQNFVVDVELKTDMKVAAHSDDFSKTVNYDEVAVLIHETIQGPSVNLIEHLAEKIGDAIMERFPRIDEVEVTVHKPNAPVSVPFGDVSVTLKFER